MGTVHLSVNEPVPQSQNKNKKCGPVFLVACADKFLCERGARFTVNNSVLPSVSIFKPKSSDFLPPETVNVLVQQYPRCGIALMHLFY